MPKSYTVDDDYNDSRLDKWFKNKIINLPHSLLEKIFISLLKLKNLKTFLFKQKHITISNNNCRNSTIQGCNDCGFRG